MSSETTEVLLDKKLEKYAPKHWGHAELRDFTIKGKNHSVPFEIFQKLLTEKDQICSMKLKHLYHTI